MGMRISGGKCKGPEVEASLVYWRSSKGGNCGWTEQVKRRVGKVGGVGSSHEVSAQTLERDDGDLLS